MTKDLHNKQFFQRPRSNQYRFDFTFFVTQKRRWKVLL